MKFGENLRNLRKSKNMSQESIAEKVRVSRQSISKWEKGQVKSLSNVISLIGKIGAIVLKVAIPFVIIAMILVPYLVNNVEVNDETISFKTENIKRIDDKIEVCKFMVITLEGDLSEEQIISIINNNSKVEIIAYLEAGMVFIIINLIIMIIMLTYVEKLFENIKNNNTPFILENVTYIKKISYLMISLIVINPIVGILFGSILGVPEKSAGIELISILEILIIFIMSYIFEYGYEIQQDSKGIMYGENKE